MFGWGSESRVTGAVALDSFPHRLQPDEGEGLRTLWKDFCKTQNSRPRGLSIALRRLGYHSQRERPEDEVLDLMIAAEAFFLADGSGDKYQGELRYRLALNAAVYTTPATHELGRRQVMRLMRKAYDARSMIAHGHEPSSKDLRFNGADHSLGELMSSVRKVVTSACCRGPRRPL